MELFSTFDFGGTSLLYCREGDVFCFTVVPACMRERVAEPVAPAESMIQFKISGTPFAAMHAPGSSMRNAPCTGRLRFLEQQKSEERITTVFEYGNGLIFSHIAESSGELVRVWTEVRNAGTQSVKFDFLSGFSLGLLSPFQEGCGAGKYTLHRLQSHWAAEGRHEFVSLENAGLEKSPRPAGMRSLRFGQRGTLPVQDYFPFAGLEDAENHVLWGVQLECTGSWELEISRIGNAVNISGGWPEREFSGWTGTLGAGKFWKTMPCRIACVHGDILDLFNCFAICKKQKENPERFACAFHALPEWREEKNLPADLHVLKESGVKYFVAAAGRDWLDSGKILHGLMKKIRSAGMVPGVEMEFETLPVDGCLFREHPEYFLRLDGALLQVACRCFPDFRREDVREYFLRKILAFLQDSGIRYVQMECGAGFSCGCDGADSPQENQRHYTESVYRFYRELREKMPDLTLGIGASGGGRLSLPWLELADAGSFSEAYEAPELPMIALDVQMLTPQSQSLVRVAIRKTDGEKRLFFMLSAAMLGRMSVSGDISELHPEQLEIVRRGTEMYREIAPVQRDGKFRLSHVISDVRTVPEGWQVFQKSGTGAAYAVMHTFANPPERLSCRIPEGMACVKSFCSGSFRWEIHGNSLEVIAPESFEGAVFFFVPDGDGCR